MKKPFKILLFILLLIAVGGLTALYVANHDVPVLSPKGVIGLKERHLIVTASLLMLIVVVPVFILTFFFAWRYRDGRGKGKHTPDWEHNYLAEYCWWGVPFIIVIVLSILTWRTSHELSPYKPLVSDVKPLKIQAVALDWKWLFIYPEQGIATVNYLQFPVDTPLDFEITADAPMNSFWIPELGGQIYAMPGMRTQLHLMANQTGTFLGRSANFSGKGFAGMRFDAVSSTRGEFDSWVNQVKRSQKRLGQVTYEALVAPSEYVPVSYYNLSQPELFDSIIDKYMVPEAKRG